MRDASGDMDFKAREDRETRSSRIRRCQPTLHPPTGMSGIASASGPLVVRRYLLQLPRATVAMLDAIRERQGPRSRSQALLQLIEQGKATAQQMT